MMISFIIVSSICSTRATPNHNSQEKGSATMANHQYANAGEAATTSKAKSQPDTNEQTHIHPCQNMTIKFQSKSQSCKWVSNPSQSFFLTEFNQKKTSLIFKQLIMFGGVLHFAQSRCGVNPGGHDQSHYIQQAAGGQLMSLQSCLIFTFLHVLITTMWHTGAVALKQFKCTFDRAAICKKSKLTSNSPFLISDTGNAGDNN